MHWVKIIHNLIKIYGKHIKGKDKLPFFTFKTLLTIMLWLEDDAQSCDFKRCVNTIGSYKLKNCWLHTGINMWINEKIKFRQFGAYLRPPYIISHCLCRMRDRKQNLLRVMFSDSIFPPRFLLRKRAVSDSPFGMSLSSNILIWL